MDNLCHTVSSTHCVCDVVNNVNGKIINIMCNGNAITNDLTGKIVCGLPVNRNVFLGATVWEIGRAHV